LRVFHHKNLLFANYNIINFLMHEATNNSNSGF